MESNLDQLHAIAMRIKDLREIDGLSAAQVAQKAGIDLADYEAYETGESDFSFSHLFNIAKVLGVDISDLLTGESPKLHGYILTRADEGLIFKRRDQYVYHHLAYNFKDKLAEPFIVTVSEDGDKEKQAHSHEGQEFDYVLDGTLKIVLGGQELFLQKGDSIYYDSSLPHVMYALEGECRFIAVVIKEGAK
ncbi:MAG TPA: XRE family transcriptional regulator [Candidatus Limiplasma sp.]|nr:XRE family transcriptional regulator [Candidatus Limiplasma sp.]